MKKLTNIIILFLLSIIVPINVLAAEIESQIILDSDDITKGEKLKATIRLDQISSYEMTAFQTRITFDENIFQSIDEASIKGYNGWENIKYNGKTHTLIAINKYGSTLNEDVVSFDLILKDDAKPTNTKVGLKNTILANAETEINLTEKNDTVKVNLLANQTNTHYETTENYGKSLISKPVKLYYRLTLIVMVLIISIILVMIYFSMSRKINTRLYKAIVITVLCLIEGVSISLVFRFDINKGDLNSDKLINILDIEVLEKHLINSEMLSNFKLEKGDLNGDGLLTPKDLAILMSKTFAKTKYEAKLSDAIMENNGYEKGSVIGLRFLADVTGDEQIEYVLIGGKKYKVDRLTNTTNKVEYMVKVPTENESKKYNYNVTEVILANGRSAKVDYGTNIVILKDKPVLKDFATKEDIEHSQMKVAFNLLDNDNAITTATYELLKTNGTVVNSGNLVSGKNTLSLTLENAVPYKLKIKALYNRGADSGAYAGIIEDSYDLKLITDYRFSLTNLNLMQNGTETRSLEKNTETYLTFTSSNVSGYNPKKITINNQEYVVSAVRDGRFKVRIPNILLNGQALEISKVTLSNGKVIVVNEMVGYNILKLRPTITSITEEEDVEASLLKVGASIKDEDNVIKKLYVKLYDKLGNFLSETSTDTKDYSNLLLTTKDTDKYIIKFYADYNRGQGVQNKELLAEKTVPAKLKAKINNSATSELYPDKNSTVTLEYNIQTNYDNVNVKNIVINNLIYNVRKTDISTYQVDVNVGETSGIKNYKVDKVIFDDDREFKVNNELKLDVLREEPMLDNFAVTENLEENTITVNFDLYDSDNAFTGGVLKLSEKDTGQLVTTREIIPGVNSVDFTLENAKKYIIDCYINADLDTKTLDPNSPNVLNDYKIYNVEYRIISDYRLEITSIDTQENGESSQYFDKKSEIDVVFASNNISEYYPIKAKVNGTMYDLEIDDGVYKFKYITGDEVGTESLRFESIVLSNYKEINLDVIKRIEILKDVPNIHSVDITKEENRVIVNAVLEDEDNAISESKIIIKDSTSNIVYEGLASEPAEFIASDNIYNISVIASYNLNDNELELEKNIYNNVELFNRTIDFREAIETSANIIDYQVLKPVEDEDEDNSESESEVEVQVEGGEAEIPDSETETIEKAPLLSITRDDLETLKGLEIILTKTENREESHIIYDYIVGEENITLLVKNDGWFMEENKIVSYIPISLTEEEDGTIYLSKREPHLRNNVNNE